MKNLSYYFLPAMLIVSTATATTVTWDASSNLFPNQITPPWTLFDAATPENPVLSGGALTLATSGLETLLYRMTGSQLSVPAILDITFTLRFVSGSAGVTRGASGVGFYPAPNVGNNLWFETDTIFLNGPGDVRGPSVALDTDGAFHDYEIQIIGGTVGSTINVFQDTILVLSGALIAQSSADADINWGCLTESASGSAQWKSFSHNAAVPEPGTCGLLTGGLLIVASRGWRRPGNVWYQL